jgi:hypothetical protein
LRVAIATLRWHQTAMNHSPIGLKWVFLCLACLSLSSCAAQSAAERMADMPHWMGGLPDGVPPRRGTPEYDAWMAARAEEAARPKAAQKAGQDKQADPAK